MGNEVYNPIEVLNYNQKHHDDCEDRKSHGNMLSVGWAIFAILVILIIAFIWQRNNHYKVCEAKELGELKAANSYNRQGVAMLDARIYQDEKYGFWEKPIHCPQPCPQPYAQHCNPCGGGYPQYGNYGNCGGGYPGPGFLVNGYPPYQVPVTTFNKQTTYEPKTTVVTECETV